MLKHSKEAFQFYGLARMYIDNNILIASIRKNPGNGLRYCIQAVPSRARRMDRYILYVLARCADVCLSAGWAADCVGRLGILHMEEASFYRL